MVAGTGGLTKAGTGTLTLTSTNNSYGGPTAINAGTLFATQPGALPSYATFGATTVASSATLMVESDTGSGWSARPARIDTLLNNASFAAYSTLGISVSGGVVTYSTDIGLGSLGTSQSNKNFLKAGAGELVLNGANSYTGTTTVSRRHAAVQHRSVSLPTAGYVDNGTLAFNLPTGSTISAPVTSGSGSGNLYWAGPGADADEQQQQLGHRRSYRQRRHAADWPGAPAHYVDRGPVWLSTMPQPSFSPPERWR